MEIRVEQLIGRHTPGKRWGWEEWIVNNEWYCGKRLHFDVLNGSTSLHFHSVKHETMYVESGRFTVTIVDTVTAAHAFHTLDQGDSIVIPPNTPHRITAVTVPAVLVEFSTHHDDSDSHRVEP